MYYYLLYNSSFSFIVENRLFSTIFYGSILYILTHAVLNYCDISLLTIINNYFWTTLSLDIISFTYAVYNSHINNGVDSNGKTNGKTNNGSGDSNHMNVSFNLLKNKINTMLDRKNDLTITQIPQTKISNLRNNTNTNTNNKQLQENFNNINDFEKSNNQIENSNNNNELDFSDLDNIDDINNIGSQAPSTQYSTPISHLKGKKNLQNNSQNNSQQNLQNNSQQNLQKSTPINMHMNNNNNNKQGSASTPINIIRNNVKIEAPMIQDDNDMQYGNGIESVAGSDVGSIMDLADFENSF